MYRLGRIASSARPGRENAPNQAIARAVCRRAFVPPAGLGRVFSLKSTHHPPQSDQGRSWGPTRVIFLLLLMCFYFQPITAGQLTETRRVLIFNELGLWSPGVSGRGPRNMRCFRADALPDRLLHRKFRFQPVPRRKVSARDHSLR